MGARHRSDGRGSRWAWILAVTSIACLISFSAWAHGDKGDKKGCAARTAKWATPDANSRAGVAPKHGGKPLRAPNDYHHFEAVFTPPSLVKFYLYDAAGQPIQGAYFKGTVKLRGEKGAPAPFVLAPDGTLEAKIPSKMLPFALDAQISYGGPSGGPKPFSHVFRVGFGKPAPQLKATSGP